MAARMLSSDPLIAMASPSPAIAADCCTNNQSKQQRRQPELELSFEAVPNPAAAPTQTPVLAQDPDLGPAAIFLQLRRGPATFFTMGDGKGELSCYCFRPALLLPYLALLCLACNLAGGTGKTQEEREDCKKGR